MTIPRGHVLVTSASQKAPLIVALRAAAERFDPTLKVIAGDTDPEAPARYVAQGFWHMPPLGETGTAEVIEACRGQGIRLVLPTRDGELSWWAERRQDCAAGGIAVVVSPPAAIERCLDKLAFADFAVARGLPAIPAASSIAELGPGPTRFVVKERFGAGSAGIGLDLDTEQARQHATGLQSPVFQPFVPGREISIDAWCDRSGSVHGLVLRSRDRILRGESQVTTTFRDAALEATAHRFLEHCEFFGPIVMQAVVGDDDSLSVIEINARFGGASTASISVGLDSLYWSLAAGFESEANTPEFRRAGHDIRQVRLPSDLVVHDPDF